MKKRRHHIILAILNIIGFLGTIVVNGLANALPINNKTTGQLSDQYPNLFVPAGLTFSIWGLIYILLAIFVIYTLVRAIRATNGESFIDRIGILFFLSCVANIGWIFTWHYEIVPLSLCIMLFLFGCLLAIYIRLAIGSKGSTTKQQYVVHLPFSVYLGWITIATIANVTALLIDLNWSRFGLSEQVWTVVVIVVGILIALVILIKRQDIFYCLVVDWALIGILIKRLTDSTPVQSVIMTAIIGLVLITAGIVMQLVRKKIYSAGAS